MGQSGGHFTHRGHFFNPLHMAFHGHKLASGPPRLLGKGLAQGVIEALQGGLLVLRPVVDLAAQVFECVVDPLIEQLAERVILFVEAGLDRGDQLRRVTPVVLEQDLADLREALLVIVGGLFVAEVLSVILQVLSYRLRGRRIFRMAPLHHHFELKGWPEPRVIVRFWIITVILVLVGLATLKIR